ncbi:MAG: YceI family protein [Synoicihabitans sp.]
MTISISRAFASLVFFTFGAVGALSAKDYRLVDHTIQWTGSTPVKYHTGLLSPQSSSIKISDAGVVEHLEVVLDMNSINVTDMDEGRMRDRLTGHLKNEDFFDVSSHPTARFTMKRHEAGHLKGELEIRGNRMDFSIPVKVSGDAVKGWDLTGKFSFDRHEFDVSYQADNLLSIAKDKLVDREIVVDVALKVSPVK